MWCCRSLLGMLFALCVVCGHLSSQTTPVKLPSCTIPGVGTPDSVWRQVRAAGFSFCVPASWQPRGHAHDSLDATRWNCRTRIVRNLGSRPPA